MTTPEARGNLLRYLRAQLRPEDIGMSSGLNRRRVEGLRREEVARAAGISLSYYTRLEQGRVHNVSPDILDSLAQVMRMTAAQAQELHHAIDHAETQRTGPARSRRTDRQAVAPVLTQTLDALAGTPALIIDRSMAVLRWNSLAGLLLGDFALLEKSERNIARLVFLDTGWGRSLLADRSKYARVCVDNLRRAVHDNPDDSALVGLIGELSVKSIAFRHHWAQQPRKERGSPAIVIHHPAVGPVQVAVDALCMADAPHQALLVHRPLNTASAGKLHLLVDAPEDDLGATSHAPTAV
ncbi:helix-turn-helix transcriptional regulator [Streptomyces sp. NPDC005794]|uniref:helix-turn-helix transcriptional regulator n=1 Tax=Streptomyces sp. NPDC005794 TaxID=3364733 RepID=UPI0036B00B42